jgi:hypothetical protein
MILLFRASWRNVCNPFLCSPRGSPKPGAGTVWVSAIPTLIIIRPTLSVVEAAGITLHEVAHSQGASEFQAHMAQMQFYVSIGQLLGLNFIPSAWTRSQRIAGKMYGPVIRVNSKTGQYRIDQEMLLRRLKAVGYKKPYAPGMVTIPLPPGSPGFAAPLPQLPTPMGAP